MARRLFDPEKIAQLLEPQRFLLNLPEVRKNGISFVRPSCVDRLFEHIRIQAGNPVYAETTISAAWFTSCHACVSEIDHCFRNLLSDGAEFHTSWISTSAEAKAWKRRLVENADAYSVEAARVVGPPLVERLQAVFDAIDAYVHRLGNMYAIFDREYAFFTEAVADERAEAERIATLAHSMLYLNSEDSKIASLALVRFGAEVEGRDRPFHGVLPHRDKELAAKLILLADFVRRERLHVAKACGQYSLHRP